MLNAKGLPQADPCEDTGRRIARPDRLCQTHLAIVSRYCPLDRLHAQYELSLLVPCQWALASNTSSCSSLRQSTGFLDSFAAILANHFPFCLPLLLFSFLSGISPAVSFRGKEPKIHRALPNKIHKRRYRR